MRILKHLPNAVTLCNLLCGCLAIVFALRSELYLAFVFILFGAFFDFCDGLTARLLHAYSDIGKQLDSLSDMVTFGVAPALMGFEFLSSSLGYVALIPLFLAVCTALRLARFNIDDSQKESFSGLPAPAAALLFASLTALLEPCDLTAGFRHFNTSWLPVIVVTACSVLVSALMVSKIPMLSFKFRNLSLKENRGRFIILSVALVEVMAILLFSTFFAGDFRRMIPLAFFVIILTYILYNLLSALFSKLS